MEFVGGRDVDRIHTGIEQRIEAGHGARDAVLRCVPAATHRVAAEDSGDVAAGGADGVDHPFALDVARANQSPTHAVHDAILLPCFAPQLSRTTSRASPM